MNTSPFTYRLVENGKVEINDGLYTFRLDRESLLKAIHNVKCTHNDYKTEAAYQASLAKYQGALAFLDAQKVVVA